MILVGAAQSTTAKELLARIGLAALLPACLGLASSLRAETLLWHEVRLDETGKLLSWVQGEAPYDHIVRIAWAAFKRIPRQADGYPAYFTYPTFYGPNDSAQTVFAGRPWVHHPGGLFAMLTDSAIQYYAYSGDHEVLDRAREMLDHLLAYGCTRPGDAWASVPYSCSDAGSLTYRGADDTRYWDPRQATPGGRGDGVGFLEPDKVGEIGHALLRFYQVTRERNYLHAALRCADALARHVQVGDESHSPWPFRVDAATGKTVRDAYTANTVGPIRLLDELLRLRLGSSTAYRRARDLAWAWLRRYPLQNHVWTQYFEDIYNYPDYRTNLNQYSPLETARYLLEHPELDPDWRRHAVDILEWVTRTFAADSVTMAGLPEKGVQWGAEAISEQVNDMDKMSSHTARYASVRALWFEKTGDTDSKARAFRSFNWATYAARENGLVKSSLDEGTGYWFSDGYGDYMRHFLRGLASVPEWAPAHEAHCLGSTSVIRFIRYRADEVRYETFDQASTETLRLPRRPTGVQAGSRALTQVSALGSRREGFTVEAVSTGGYLLRIRHARSPNLIRVVFPADR